MYRNRPEYNDNDGGITLDATDVFNSGQRGAGNWRSDNPAGGMPSFERGVHNRRSDQQQLINGGRQPTFQAEQLPQVYGEILTPSTPGMDEGKALIKNTKAPISSGSGPKDRCGAVYLIILINGIGTLMPWNMFITADAYFREEKLRGTVFAENFQSYLGIASQVPNLLFNLLNLFIQVKGSLTIRILTSLMLMVIIFIATTVLAMVDSSTWPGTFFGITMASVVLINCAVGVYQNCVYGLAADLPIRYSNAVVLGSNISGTLVSLVNIITMSMSADKRISAIYYFVSALFVLLVCFDSYFALPLCRFFRFHHERAHAHRLAEDAIQQRLDPNKSYLHVYISVVKKAWIQMFNIFFVFFVTLTIFPAMQTDVMPVDKDFWLPADIANNKNYFKAITCFLFFNVFAVLGSVISHWVRVPGPRFVWIPILLRGLFIPTFMFCNYRPDTRLLPIYIDNDYAYIGLGILMAVTSGYFSSLVMMYTPRVVSPDKARVAAMMATFFLILGIFAGVNFTLVVAQIVGHRKPDSGVEGLSFPFPTVTPNSTFSQ